LHDTWRVLNWSATASPCADGSIRQFSRGLRKAPIAARGVQRPRDMPPQHDPTLLGIAPGIVRARREEIDRPAAPQLAAVRSVVSAMPAPAPVLRRYRIVVGIDLSEYADIVIEHALDQAARHDAPELHFLTVRERRKPTADEQKQALLERVHPALEAFNRHGIDWRAQIHVRRGKPDVEIAGLAADLRADLIVIGQFGLHTPRASDRNLPNRILQRALCPTLVVSMPAPLDSPQCATCAQVREQTEGERWFCAEHGDSDHVVSPMTTWSGGSMVGSRVA
jgi:nucleotide-binding universal stress UspA family protein